MAGAGRGPQSGSAASGYSMYLSDPAASENFHLIVENGGLAGGYGALRLIETDTCTTTGKSFDPGDCRFMLVANFDEGTHGLRRFGDGNPVYVFDGKGACAQGSVVANNHTIGFLFDGDDVERLARREAEPLALADSEIVNAVVAAEDFAGFAY